MRHNLHTTGPKPTGHLPSDQAGSAGHEDRLDHA
jgi:hypothetical protein